VAANTPNPDEEFRSSYRNNALAFGRVVLRGWPVCRSLSVR